MILLLGFVTDLGTTEVKASSDEGGGAAEERKVPRGARSGEHEVERRTGGAVARDQLAPVLTYAASQGRKPVAMPNLTIYPTYRLGNGTQVSSIYRIAQTICPQAPARGTCHRFEDTQPKPPQCYLLRSGRTLS